MALVSQIIVPVAGRALPLETWLTADVKDTPFGRDALHPRSAMILSTTNWLARGKVIELFINPREIGWSVPRRETVVKTAAGAVRNTWRNRYRNSYLDEFMLNITFQTGNIMPSAGTEPGAKATSSGRGSNVALLPSVGVPRGLQNFYDFLDLIDQPALRGPRENRHLLIMYTRTFPVMRFEGYFTGDPITWTESADNANQLVWQAAFQVYKTVPKLTSASQLTSVYMSWVETTGRHEAVPPAPRGLAERAMKGELPPPAPRGPNAGITTAKPFAGSIDSLGAFGAPITTETATSGTAQEAGFVPPGPPVG